MHNTTPLVIAKGIVKESPGIAVNIEVPPAPPGVPPVVKSTTIPELLVIDTFLTPPVGVVAVALELFPLVTAAFTVN